MRSILALCFFLLFSGSKMLAQSYTFQHSNLPCVGKEFNIVAHIFRDSLGDAGVQEADIEAAVQQMNVFFKPICVSFKVCDFRYHDNFKHDVLDEPMEVDQIVTKYHADYRINMYFLTFFPGACGFASLGGITEPFRSNIFIKKEDCVTVRTLAHEMGHFFSLLHTFEGSGTELVDGSNCDSEGDLICDTPADPYIEDAPLENYVDPNCRFIYTPTDAQGDYYNPDLGNIMSYYECGSCGFTWQQLKKMADAYMNSGVKFW